VVELKGCNGNSGKNFCLKVAAPLHVVRLQTKGVMVTVLIAGIVGASLGTEIAKSLRLAGGYHVIGCDPSPLGRRQRRDTLFWTATGRRFGVIPN